MLNKQAITESNLSIIGSRSFDNFTYAKRKIIDIITKNKISITKIISGGANGADKIAEMFAQKYNIPIEVIKADWETGKQAGVIRNTEIIKKSDCVIAFWDGESKGTLDSINKAKRAGKKLFVIDISPEAINEGVRVDGEDNYVFDFNKDEKEDILTLRYNKEHIVTKKLKDVIVYFSFKINKKIDKGARFKLLNSIKHDLTKTNQYEQLLNKAVIGLFNNKNFDPSDTDLILIPESSSQLNFDLANKVKNKIPNALFLSDAILKNELENVSLDYEKLKSKRYKNETIIQLENIIKKAQVNGIFKIKKVAPKFRKFVINFLMIDLKDKQILNKITDGNIMVIDDFVSEGTTLLEVNRLIENYTPKKVILYSLIG